MERSKGDVGSKQAVGMEWESRRGEVRDGESKSSRRKGLG